MTRKIRGIRWLGMSDSDVEIINDYGLQKRTRTLKSGDKRSRYTVTISSEPILIQTNPKALSRQIADATAQIYRERIEAITATVSPATMRARLSAQKAVVQGQAWAMKRYSGGKTGTMAPARSDRMFNDSGRFAKSIKVGATSSGWVVNVAANRLDPNTLNGGEAALLRIVERLREFVPEWGDPQALNRHLTFRRALDDSLKMALQKANERTVELKKQIMQATFGRLLQLVA